MVLTAIPCRSSTFWRLWNSVAKQLRRIHLRRGSLLLEHMGHSNHGPKGDFSIARARTDLHVEQSNVLLLPTYYVELSVFPWGCDTTGSLPSVRSLMVMPAHLYQDHSSAGSLVASILDMCPAHRAENGSAGDGIVSRRCKLPCIYHGEEVERDDASLAMATKALCWPRGSGRLRQTLKGVEAGWSRQTNQKAGQDGTHSTERQGYCIVLYVQVL